MGYARKDIEKTKKIAKKFVRYQEGAELYSMGLTKFQELAKEAKAVYKIDNTIRRGLATLPVPIGNSLAYFASNSSHGIWSANFTQRLSGF